MLNILAVTFPFFALIFLGYLAAWRQWLPTQAIAGLNTFVLFFALPCMLYRFGASTPIWQLLDAPLFVSYLCCALIMVGVVVAFSLNARIRWNDAAFGALVAAFPNTGFMGAPLLVALLGQAAAGPLIVTIAIDMVITTSLCIALSRLDSADEHGVAHALQKAFKGMLSNPMPWAIVLGALSSASGWQLVTPVAKTVGMLADAASPVALFTIGAVLARFRMQSTSSQPQSPWQAIDFWPIVGFKLIVHPLLVWSVLTMVAQAGFVLSHSTVVVVTLVAALPSASNVAMLTERFGAHTARVALIILLSTTLAFFTLPVAIALLNTF